MQYISQSFILYSDNMAPWAVRYVHVNKPLVLQHAEQFGTVD